MTRQNNARRKGLKALIVDPYQQIKVGVVFLLINLLFCFLISAIFYYFFNDIISTMEIIYGLTPEGTGDLRSKYSAFVYWVSGAIFIFTLVTLFVSFKTTHRIHGPLISINRYLDQLAEGHNPDPIHLRDRDQLKDLATKINKAVGILKNK